LLAERDLATGKPRERLAVRLRLEGQLRSVRVGGQVGGDDSDLVDLIGWNVSAELAGPALAPQRTLSALAEPSRVGR
jgi:hypothetical protein